jgi:hypothetical protein
VREVILSDKFCISKTNRNSSTNRQEAQPDRMRIEELEDRKTMRNLIVDRIIESTTKGVLKARLNGLVNNFALQ